MKTPPSVSSTADFDGNGSLDIAVSRPSKATVFYAQTNGATFDSQDIEFVSNFSGSGVGVAPVGTSSGAPLSLVITGSEGGGSFKIFTP